MMTVFRVPGADRFVPHGQRARTRSHCLRPALRPQLGTRRPLA